MVRIPAGTFIMGSPKNEVGHNDDETQWRVRLSGFYMGRTEITQEQYEKVTGKNPSRFSTANDEEPQPPAEGENGSRRPVERVSWYDAVIFCNKLSIMEGLIPAYSILGKTDPDEWGEAPQSIKQDGYEAWDEVEIAVGADGYRLPTEAQWEYACRAGTSTAFNTGNTISDGTGWYKMNSGDKTHEVGKKSANAYGLYDMHGNVWEWCWDWYGTYPNEEQTDPAGAPTGSFRVVRGGSFFNSEELVRSAFREDNAQYRRNYPLGFRIVRL